MFSQLEMEMELRSLLNDANAHFYFSHPRKGAANVYLAGGWFTQKQQQDMLAAYTALLNNPSIASIHVPLLHQNTSESPIDAEGKFNPSFKWSTLTYKADKVAIDKSDVVVAILSNGENDTGTVWEIGYAEGRDIPVIGAFTDGEAKYNLMPAMSVTSNYMDMTKLDSINMIDIEPNAWEREVE